MLVVPGLILSFIICNSVFWLRFSTVAKKHVLISISMPPKTHCPSTCRPLWYFLFPNLLSSISTTTPSPLSIHCFFLNWNAHFTTIFRNNSWFSSTLIMTSYTKPGCYEYSWYRGQILITWCTYLSNERWRFYDLTLASILFILIFWFKKKSCFNHNLTRGIQILPYFCELLPIFHFQLFGASVPLYTYLLLFPVLFVGSAKVVVLF